MYLCIRPVEEVDDTKNIVYEYRLKVAYRALIDYMKTLDRTDKRGKFWYHKASMMKKLMRRVWVDYKIAYTRWLMEHIIGHVVRADSVGLSRQLTRRLQSYVTGTKVRLMQDDERHTLNRLSLPPEHLP